MEEIREKLNGNSQIQNKTEFSESTQTFHKIQKLLFANLLSFGQNFKFKSCRSCFDLQVLFWQKSKFSSTFERKVDLILSQIKKLNRNIKFQSKPRVSDHFPL